MAKKAKKPVTMTEAAPAQPIAEASSTEAAPKKAGKGKKAQKAAQ